MAHAAHGILELVTEFVNALYRAANGDFDTLKFASKTAPELADIGFNRDDVALVVRPHHLNA